MEHRYEVTLVSAWHEVADEEIGFLHSRVWADIQTYLHAEEVSIIDQLREIDPITEAIKCARLQGRLQQVRRDLEIPGDLAQELEKAKEKDDGRTTS